MGFPNKSHYFLLVLFFLPSWCFAIPDNSQIREFSWRGLSLNQSPSDIEALLSEQGFQLRREREQGRNNIIRRNYTKGRGNNGENVVIRVLDEQLISVDINLTNASDGQNAQETADKHFADIQAALTLSTFSGCRALRGGGGTCVGESSDISHRFSWNIRVDTKKIKIRLESRPLSEQRVAQNQQRQALENARNEDIIKAFSCFQTVDTTSPEDLYACLGRAEQDLSSFFTTHGVSHGQRLVRLSQHIPGCYELNSYFARARAFEEHGSEAVNKAALGERRSGGSTASVDELMANVPSCSTWAEVINLAKGQIPGWTACADPSDDPAFIKHCLEGAMPQLKSGNLARLPACDELQSVFRQNVFYGSPQRLSNEDIPKLECSALMQIARDWRGNLPPVLQACDNYDSSSQGEHARKCLNNRSALTSLRDCQSVQRAYEQRIINVYGYLPDGYILLPCNLANPILADAEAEREKIRQEVEEQKRLMAEQQRKIREARQAELDAINARMAKRYNDTEERIASRTSPLEKQLSERSLGELANCATDNERLFYCQPTAEEIRLAMMRYTARRTGFKMVSGELLYGHQPTGLSFIMSMLGRSDLSGPQLGIEMQYGDARVSRCFYKDYSYYCRFTLPIRHDYDEATKRYLQGWNRGVPFNFNQFMMSVLSAETYSDQQYYSFWIDNDGLWQASITLEEQLEGLNARLRSIEARLW